MNSTLPFFTHAPCNWTLFVDRDGVINYEYDKGNIKTKEEFIFYPRVIESFALLKPHFDKTIVVTHQRGVGLGTMTINTLEEIHHYMLNEIKVGGGSIDKIYCCTDVDRTTINRKPNIGMALQAKSDFPSIDFSYSIMVGNRLSDMQFGRNAGMKTILITSTHQDIILPHPLIDASFNDLWSFAQSLTH
ncbi:MAG: HAD-IIIA family hydrolase [Phycisphaerales bacterium]|nr:HAD-IIIA family hydrolase [Phycisphaerales bacterium]